MATAIAFWPEVQLPPQKSVSGMVSGVVADLTAGLPTVGSRELEWAQDMIYNIITTLSLILTSIPPPPPRATPASAHTRVWEREPARRYLPRHVARVPASSACPSVPVSSACPNTSASSPVPASLNVPASLACPNTSASLASSHVPVLPACPHAPASSRHVGAGHGISRDARTEARAWPHGDVGAKKGPCGAITAPATGNTATDRAGRDKGNHTIPNGGRANNPCEGMSQGVSHPTHHVSPLID